MAILPNPRHEKFAQALAEGKPATAAYEEAGYSPNDGNAVRLKGNEKIKSRVAELQGQGAERAVVTLQSLIAEAGDIQTKALAKGHYSAAISALTVKAKLSGHWVDRSENQTSNVASSATPLFDFQIFGGLASSVADDLVFDLLAFAQRAQSGPFDRGNVHELR
jgi:hypothetical protein